MHPKSYNCTYDVIIPVFNSEKTIAEVVRRLISYFYSKNIDYKIILVNDGSNDDSWNVLSNLASDNRRVIAIDLLKNYGQHNANFCGFMHSNGDYVITMDDDLQNPPEEIESLINKTHEGHDLVMGSYIDKKHSFHRKIASNIIGYINTKIFSKPANLRMSNFRIISKGIISRIKEFKGSNPYIPGLLIAHSMQPCNVEVSHLARPIGRSQYSLYKLLKLTMSLLFNYSTYPLRLLVLLGVIVSLASFSMSLYFIFRGLIHDVRVPGWTSVVTLISFFSGFIILLLGVIGEYVIHVVRTMHYVKPYHIRDRHNFDEA